MSLFKVKKSFKSLLHTNINTLFKSKNDKINNAVLSIFLQLYFKSDSCNVQLFIDFFKKHQLSYNEDKLRELISQNTSPYSYEEAIEILEDYSQKETLMLSLIQFCYLNEDYEEEEREFIYSLSKNWNIAEIANLEEIAEQSFLQQRRIRKSRTALIAIGIIIAIFIVVTLFLKSVLFGISLAYLSIPVQRFIYKLLMKSRLNKVLMPLYKKHSLEEKTNLFSCYATVGLIIIITLLLCIAVPINAVNYIQEQNASIEFSPRVDEFVEESKQNEAIIQGYFEQAKSYITAWFQKSIDNVIGTGFSIISFIGGFLFDLVLTLFFYSFFLQKIIEFKNNNEKQSIGKYISSTVFSSPWIPNVSEDDEQASIQFINVVEQKFRAWIKGYFLIIIVESICYLSFFYMMNVPYALVLGLIAGSTILLPFLGPLISAVLTLLVCLVFNDFSWLDLGLIAGFYLLMNGILEQFIFVPKFIGESLDLTLLESILVILLGGLLAGIVGVIFAIPIASILKYLIPQIYARWSK